jgi:pyruvate formate lyase activating enzyme
VNRELSIEVNGKRARVQDGITVKRALEMTGYEVTEYPKKSSLFVPCEVGGCWGCAVEVKKQIRPACITAVRDGLRIRTQLPDDYIPKRIVHGFTPHTVGGVGTPWWLKGGHGYIEATCFAAGCKLRCPQCQNWETTYKGKGKALTPQEAAEIMTSTRKRFGVDRMAISGGESTLNRGWLVECLREVKRLNLDPHARIHVDTNASIVTRDYVDDLVEAGMTDIGPDLKGYYPETFTRITGIEDRTLAERYFNAAWDAAQYLIESYKERVFMGIGIPIMEN